jgi:hypothetical protein
MLIFSGIGSLFSEKIIHLFRKNILLVFLIIAGLVILIGLLNPVIFEFFVRADILWRVVISILLIAPLAFFMGIPFPYGIKQIPAEKDSSRYLAAYSWGVNGFFSVIGSVLVVMLSMSYGFKVVFVTSAVIYLAAMITVKTFDAAKI